MIQRDRLVSCLLEEVEEKYAAAVRVTHGVACVNVEWRPGGGATLTREATAHDGTPATTQEAGAAAVEARVPFAYPARTLRVPFVVGAEGASTRNAVMHAMDGDDSGACGTTMMRFDDANPRVYKTIPIKLPDSFRTDLSYSARTKAGVALECLPTKEGLLVGVLLVKPGDEETCAKLESKESLRRYFDEDFPMFAEYVSDDDLERMAARRLSTLPTFAYAGGGCLHRVAEGAPSGDASGDASAADAASAEGSEEVGGACLLGDSIHTVKPYFGLGVNSALEDVTVLDDCLTRVGGGRARKSGGEGAGEDEGRRGGGWTAALPEFSRRRAADAKALVDISRGFDGGFLTFVLPLILDGIFHSLAPALFAPNTIQMLQKEDWTFSRVARRKRRDRTAQVGIIAAVLACVAWAVASALRMVLS